MQNHTLLIISVLVIILFMIIVLRFLSRKLRMRRAWAAIRAEREDNKRAFARLAAQIGEPDSSGPRLSLDVPDFPDQQWQTVVARGAAALMTPEQRREVEELYADLARLRSSAAKLAAVTGGAPSGSSPPPGSAGGADAIHAARRALLAEMHRFQPLHTDFDVVLPRAAI